MKKGFTLIELLVVVAIIATLGALSFPAIVSAMQGARAAVSMSNLHILAAANLAYVGDNEGYCCPAQEPTNMIRWHGARTGASGQFDPTKGFLSPYIDYSDGLIIDPLFKPTVSGGSSFEDGSGGYGYNEIYIGGTPQNNYQGILYGNIPTPGKTVMFTTTAFAMSGGLQEYPFSEAPQWVDPNNVLSGGLQPSCHFRANGKALVAWCDGHVTAEKPTVLGGTDYYGGDSSGDNIGWFGPTDDNGYWNPNFSGNEDIPTMPTN